MLHLYCEDKRVSKCLQNMTQLLYTFAQHKVILINSFSKLMVALPTAYIMQL